MKRKITTVLLAMLLAVGAAIGFCACTDREDIDSALLPVEQQVTLINSTLDDMKATDKTLNDSITALTGKVTVLEGELEEVNTKISSLQTDSATKAELENVKKAMETQIEKLKSDIADLKAKDTELQNQIANLQDALTGEIKNVKDWANSTFISTEFWGMAKNEIDKSISALSLRVDNVEILIEELTACVDENETDIANILDRLEALEEENKLLKNQVNCLKGNHEWDASETTYIWCLNADITSSVCDAVRVCKHCGKEEQTSNGKVTYENYVFTADFTDWTCCTNQTCDIKDISGLNADSIKAAVSILVGDGSGDDNGEIDLTLNMPKNAGSDEYKAVIAGLEKAGDGKVNITVKGVDKITGSAFLNCKKLGSVTMGDEVKVVGNGAFNGCSELSSISFGSGIESIGASAFRSCKKLSSVVIPDSVTSIGDYAFNYCEALTSVTFKKGSKLETIGEQAFSHCTALEVVTVPKSVTSVDDAAFYGCLALKSITFEEGSKLETIGSQVFSFTKITSISIPKGVTEIGASVFEDCSMLTSIIFNGTVERLDSVVFEGLHSADCTLTLAAGQKILERANDLTYVAGNDMFCGGNVFCGITFKEIVFTVAIDAANMSASDMQTALENYVSKGATNFEITLAANAGSDVFTAIKKGFAGASDKSVTLVLKGNITSIPADAFEESKWIKSISIPDSVTSIGRYAFYNSTLETITFGENSALTSIEGYAFQNCSNLSGIVIPKGVTATGYAVFSGCSSLVNITLPDKLETIKQDLFYECVKLESVTLGKNVTSIGVRAFWKTSIKEIIIPKSVTSLGYAVFGECKLLETIKYEGTAEEWDAITKTDHLGSWNAYISETVKIVFSNTTVTS